MTDPDRLTGKMIVVDHKLLADFEDRLDPAFPEKSGIQPTILGYGEISSSFVIEQMPDIAFKRMPPFPGRDAAEEYRRIVDIYCRHLKEDCGVKVLPHTTHRIENRFGEHIVYVAQPRLEAETIGNLRLKQKDFRYMAAMVARVADRILAVGRKNRDGFGLSIGIDGQISNWCFLGEASALEEPLYFDITTPLFRVNGSEQLDIRVFLKSIPSGLVWLVKWKFLQEILDRYYDTRQVLIDLAANFHKEGRQDMIDEAIAVINGRVERVGLTPPVASLTRDEVDSYYKNDAFIWALLLSLRRADRFICTRLLRRRYNFILPGKIER